MMATATQKPIEFAKKALDIHAERRDVAETTGRSTSDVMEIVRNRLTGSLEKFLEALPRHPIARNGKIYPALEAGAAVAQDLVEGGRNG